MTHDEYTAKLNALRKEYADSIRAMIDAGYDDYDLITSAGVEASEYRLRADALIEEYRA